MALRIRIRILQAGLLAAALLQVPAARAVSEVQDERGSRVMAFEFDGTPYLHRWSKAGQNEFTPRGQADLQAWQHMVSLNVGPAMDARRLAGMARRVLDRYEKSGTVVRAATVPRTPQRPAEHLVVGVFDGQGWAEIAFVRLFLHGGVGLVAVYAHRTYGPLAVEHLRQWVRTHGVRAEEALLAWSDVPTPAALGRLPQAD